MYQFTTAKELLDLCSHTGLDIAEIGLLSEVEETGRTKEAIWQAMMNNSTVMQESIEKGIKPDIHSVGGLIGGNGFRMLERLKKQPALMGTMGVKAVSYALAVTEVNASMGKIVAAPTGGASGVVPGMIFAITEELELTKEDEIKALLIAASIGKIIAINATLSGAEGGCQAECGSAAAMAAGAAVYLMGGDPEQCLQAGAMALKGTLGLVCDPVAGLVEVPCSKRNASSVGNALVCAEMALAGIQSFIPFDEVVEAMYRIGRMMSPDLRETARGGCAATPTARNYTKQFFRS
ncbi:MAG: L-serine ammonia-lyase, iron-sulfur-dependent, subunit alpha [Bacillota bacterium]|nr:L-serine ammonia-lyase, iron-sulfur-dependent, subunit alpha [Bacillota bacterium]